MALNQVINNIWTCDQCGARTETLINPYYSVIVTCPSKLSFVPCEIALCDVCVTMLTPQAILEYIKSIDSLED